MAKEATKVDGRNLGSSTTMRCTCDHKDQDKMYGKKVRVHNKTKEGWRCTVCSKVNN